MSSPFHSPQPSGDRRTDCPLEILSGAQEPAKPLKIDDRCWDAFLPDEADDLLPEPGDFWIEDDLQEVRWPAA